MSTTWTTALNTPELAPYSLFLALVLALHRYLPHLLALYACSALPTRRARLYGRTVQTTTTPRPCHRRHCRCRCHHQP